MNIAIAILVIVIKRFKIKKLIIKKLIKNKKMKIQIKIGRRITFPARLEVNYFYLIFAYIFNMQNKKFFVTLFLNFF